MTAAQKNPLDWPTWAWLALVVVATAVGAWNVTGSLSNLALVLGYLQDDTGPLTAIGANDVAAFIALGGLLTTGLAVILMLRAGGNRAAVMLAMILLGLSFGGFPWAPTEAVGLVWQGISFVKVVLVSYFWPYFALEIAGGARSRRQLALVHAVALTATALHMSLNLVELWATEVFWLKIGLIAAVQVFGYAIIAANYRRNDAEARNRIKIVVGAFVLFMVSSQMREAIRGFLAAGYSLDRVMGLIVGANGLAYAAVALVVYAVLRRKLFNLNFALNRTLVYAGVSFVLLAAFGLAKWVIEHLIPESWHAGSEYYSVAIALGLFLVLHRVHNWVEHNIERVFFRPWHRNEEALSRFVAAAGHFDRAPVLCRAFVEEASRFAGGGAAALYLREADGSYALRCGKAARAKRDFREDDVALALMRAERGPIRIGETRSALPGELALPMLDHATLAGFLVLARKGDGTDYRPDEVAALGQATHQVGLDLQAMRARELEAEVASLREQLARRAHRKPRPRTPQLTALPRKTAL